MNVGFDSHRIDDSETTECNGDFIATDARIAQRVPGHEGNRHLAGVDAARDFALPVIPGADALGVEPDGMTAFFQVGLEFVDQFAVGVVSVTEEDRLGASSLFHYAHSVPNMPIGHSIEYSPATILPAKTYSARNLQGAYRYAFGESHEPGLEDELGSAFCSAMRVCENTYANRPIGLIGRSGGPEKAAPGVSDSAHTRINALPRAGRQTPKRENA